MIVILLQKSIQPFKTLFQPSSIPARYWSTPSAVWDKITVDQLAGILTLGRRNLQRHFKKATANTVVEYIQWVKIEAAKKGFETSRKNINEVMYEVGYTDTKAFRTVFKKITGLSPVGYRNKYNKAALVN